MRHPLSPLATSLAFALFCGCHSSKDVPEPPPSAAKPHAPAPSPEQPAPAATATAEPPSLPPNVQAVVDSQIKPEATRCFEKGLKAAPAQAGSVLLIAKIKPDGKVATVSAGAEGALSVDTVDCIQWVAKRADFDPPGGDAGTYYRIELRYP